jgi:ATP-binding cassette subfamily B protein
MTPVGSAAVSERPPSPLRDLPWLMRHVARAAPLPLTAWTALAGVQATLVAANLFAIHGAVDALVGIHPGGAGVWLVAVAAVFAATRLSDPLESYAREALRIAAGGYLQQAAQEKILRLPLEAFDSQQTHDIIRRVAEGADHRGPELVGEVLALLRNVPEAVAYAVAAALIASWLPAVLVVLTALLTSQLMRSGARVRALETVRTRDRRLADYYAELLTTRHYAAEVRLFGLRTELLSRWRHGLTSYLDDRLHLLFRNAVAGVASSAGFTAVLAGSLLAVVLFRHRVDPGAAALVLTAIGGLVNSLSRIAFSGREFIQHAGYAQDLRSLLDGQPAEDEPLIPAAAAGGAVGLRAPRPIRDGVRLEGVCYRYPGADTDALVNVST